MVKHEFHRGLIVSCVLPYPGDVTAFRSRENVPDESEKLSGVAVGELGQGVDPYRLDQ